MASDVKSEEHFNLFFQIKIISISFDGTFTLWSLALTIALPPHLILIPILIIVQKAF
jgi:hypothetical protein